MAKLRFDRAQADRMQNLFTQSAIARATRDQAISTRDMDSGALAQAQAELAERQFQYDHDQIRAPFAGRVVARLIHPGEYATAGTELLGCVHDRSAHDRLRGPNVATHSS